MFDAKNLKQRYFVLYALLIGLFFVLFLWRFWEYSDRVLGINLTGLWLLIIGYFVLAKWQSLNRSTLKWLVPFVIIVISFSFYKNPYTTWISFLLSPAVFFIFTTHESHRAIRLALWSKFMPFTFIFAGFKFLTSTLFGLNQSGAGEKIKNVVNKKKNLAGIIGQVVFGLIILTLLSFIVIIPLLSSADQNFANIFKNLLEKFFELFSLGTIVKTIFMAIVAVILLGALNYWRRALKPFNMQIGGEKTVSKNSIMMGIVLSGVFFLYLIFILVQIQHLFVELPNNFSETVSAVKTGFWQLFLLTIINIIFFALVFKKYARGVQNILVAFTISSLLLIVSAGHRVYLYVTNYGLSYEKLFAFYTVIFCSLIFIWFIALFFKKSEERINIIQNLVFFSLWGYAILTIMPLEKIIFSTNLNLTQKESSHVNINELTMLEFDALPIIEENFDDLIVEARKDYAQKESDLKIKSPRAYSSVRNEENKVENYVDERWNNWIKDNRKDVDVVTLDCRECSFDRCNEFELEDCDCCEKIEKKWYEKTFGEIFYKSSIEVE